MNQDLPLKLTQHQKRVIVIENLYQFFLESEGKLTFEDYFNENIKQQVEPVIANIFNDLIWNQNEIIAKIENNLKQGWNFKSLKPTERAILFLGSYEILYTSTNKAIVINEAIILAKQYCDQNVYRYINGVLDKINP